MKTAKQVLLGVILFALCLTMVWGTYFYLPATIKINRMQSEGTYPKSDIVIINKASWNNVDVYYDIDKINDFEAQSLFKSQYEKYGDRLKKLEVSLLNRTEYQVCATFIDGSTSIEKPLRK